MNFEEPVPWMRRVGSGLMAVFLFGGLLQALFPQLHVPIIELVLSALSMLTFLIHEAGHSVFGLLGQFMGALGGTLAQLLFPLLVSLVGLSRPRERVTALFFVFWLGLSLMDVSRYIGDARSQQLKLFSPQALLDGAAPIHDWHYLLGQVGLLPYDHVLAAGVYGLGLLVMLAALAAALLLAAGRNPFGFLDQHPAV